MWLERAVHAAAKALEAFETSVKSAEEHLEAFLDEDAQQQLSARESEHVRRIFHSCLMFKKAIKVILNGFYTSGDTAALRSDRNLYKVLVYLAVLGVEDIGMRAFQQLILTQHTAKMVQLLQFLFADETAITGWMRDRWLSVYDEETVDEDFIAPMLTNRPEMLELLSALEDPQKQSELRSTLRTRPASSCRPSTQQTQMQQTQRQPTVTVPEPFNLTRPKPRAIPVPKVVSDTGPPKTKPIPDSTYATPLEEAALERKREKNRRLAEKKAKAATESTFACVPDPNHWREKHQQLAQRKVQEELAQLDMQHRARPAPATVRAQVPVKLNAAAILREEKLYRQQLEDEAQRLARLEAGEFNERELQELEEKIKLEEQQQRLADIERKVLEGQLTREEALIARQEAEEQKREQAWDVKEESRRLLAHAERLRQKEDEMLRLKAAEIQQIREQAAVAVDQALEEKRKQGLAVKAEREQLLREAEERAAQEMAQRQELIREIRALETVRRDRGADFNASETMNLGLMSEMSFAELQQRLHMLRTLKQEEEEARRAVIFDAKLAKDAMLQEKMEAIQQGRMQLEMQRAHRQTQKQKLAHLERPKSQADKLNTLREKLAARKAERLQRTGQAGTPLSTSLRSTAVAGARRRTGGGGGGRRATAGSAASTQRRAKGGSGVNSVSSSRRSSTAPSRVGARTQHVSGARGSTMTPAPTVQSSLSTPRTTPRPTPAPSTVLDTPTPAQLQSSSSLSTATPVPASTRGRASGRGAKRTGDAVRSGRSSRVSNATRSTSTQRAHAPAVSS
ncbi:hypothetical protein PTSG_07583 [Salpingoeca rosetta]|uniref:Uncharacterized protein n=1 Tax=Salpingoeca rosetta (strain ATCC 50818 / BSB-021) TaxID=946362 RepID=F2UH67_SALR5|nr:uncharacterized protein PTSG_07583 [Salpingoeca rosetta]EGD76466.1 hypothetical protein PTSG_07583 [Salpingoeca rosetta]|eukprot:XP_004991381.1 hypothetical protein PTSG_07583 [Salpingoeca rosetta]